MRKNNYETFLKNEMQALSGLAGERSLKKIIEVDDYRANAYVVALLVFQNKTLKSTNEKVEKINHEVSLILNDQKSHYSQDVEKSKKLHETYLLRIKQKEVIANYEIKELYKISKEANINYANAYRFFVKKDYHALSLDSAFKMLDIYEKLKEQKFTNKKG